MSKTLVIGTIVGVLVVFTLVGLLLWQQQSSPSGQSTINNQQATIDTSTWQTYHSDEFGFDVKYPNEWQGTESGVIENKGTGSLFYVFMVNNPELFRIAASGGPTVKAITINGVKAYRVDRESPPSGYDFEIVAMIDDQRVLYSYGNSKTLEDGKTLEQILSTFRFVE